MTFRFSTRGTGFRYLSNQAIRLSLPGVDDPWGAVRTFSLSSSPSEAGSALGHLQDLRYPLQASPRAGGARGHRARLRPAREFSPGHVATVSLPGRRDRDHSLPWDATVRRRYGRAFPPDPALLRPRPRGVGVSVRARRPGALAREPPNPLHRNASQRVARPLDRASGRIDQGWLEAVGHFEEHPLVYVAGLPGMVEEMVETLTGRLGVPSDDIDYELFRGFYARDPGGRPGDSFSTRSPGTCGAMPSSSRWRANRRTFPNQGEGEIGRLRVRVEPATSIRESRGAYRGGPGDATPSAAVEPRRVAGGPEPAGPCPTAREVRQVPGPKVAPDPLRAHVDVALRVPSGIGEPDGGRPRDHSGHRHPGPALRRRPPRELRGLWDSRAQRRL